MHVTRIAALILFAAVTAAGCQGEPLPAGPQPKMDAQELVREYQFNSLRTRERYNKEWFTFTAGPVNRVNGMMAIIEYPERALELEFDILEDAYRIERNSQITVVCKIIATHDYPVLKLTRCHFPPEDVE